MGMDLQKVKAALEIAVDAMGERRGYSSAWEYKYADQWNEDDNIVREAIAELEKPADDDAMTLAKGILNTIKVVGLSNISAEKTGAMIQQYAEEYHAKRCGECRAYMETNGIDIPGISREFIGEKMISGAISNAESRARSFSANEPETPDA